MLTINPADIALYKQALKTWGRDLQLGMVAEECAELIVEISHYKRTRVGGSKVLREVAVDVAYMAEHSRNKLRDWLAKENIHDYQ